MKKRLLLSFLAIVCVLCCALGLAACKDNNKVTCTLEPTPEHVNEVSFKSGEGNILDAVLGALRDVWSVSDKIEKNKEYQIQVNLGGYKLGSLKMFINGVEIPLTKHPTASNLYIAKYTPTEDITITFSGAPELDISVSSVDVNPHEINLPIGEQEIVEVTVGAYGMPTDGIEVTAVSDHPEVATVAPSPQDGARAYIVTAINLGEAIITFAAGDKTSMCYVVVESPRTVESITLGADELALEANDYEYLSVNVTPSGMPVDVVSGNTNIVTVTSGYDNNYKVTAVGEGTTTITVKSGDKTATCKVTVVAAPQAVQGSAGLQYTLMSDNKYRVIGLGSCSDSEIVIPNYYEGKRVTSIGNAAFSYANITGVTISDGIYTIGERAFADCHSLASVTISDSVTSIGDSAFRYCLSLHSLTIPDGVTSIGIRAFGGCQFTTITIPASVTSIGDSAFEDSALESVVLSDGLTAIGKNMFFSCDFLTSITIPASVTSIGDGAFSETGFTSFIIPSGITSIGNYAFSYCRSLESVTIPASVTGIGDNAFNNCGALTEVTINNGVTSIGESAFEYCDKLYSIEIPASVISIGKGAFKYCNLLTNVTLQQGLKSIGDDAFLACGLTKITIPDSVTSIGVSAFRNCEFLFTATLGDGLTSIGDYAFNCCSLAGGITLGNNLISIGDEAFSEAKFTNFIIPASVTSIGNRAFYCCTHLESISIPSGVTSIGNEAFACCEALAEATLNNGLASIADGMFKECQNLSNLTIPASVTSIGDSAFKQCFDLTSVDLPNGLISIGDDAFSNSGLTSVNIPASVTSIGANAFGGKALESLTVDANNAAYLSQDGILYNKAKTEIICVIKAAIQGAVTIPEGVTSIGDNAFSYCDNIESVSIPASVTSIGDGAFDYCFGITGFTVEANNADYTSVDGILYNKAKTAIISIPYALQGSIVIPHGITSIDERAFWNRTNLEGIELPDSVISIGDSAFANCVALANVALGNGVESIESNAFIDCHALERIEIPNSVTFISPSAFYYCSNLIEIVCNSNFDVSNLDLTTCNKFKGTLVGTVYVFGSRLLSIVEDATYAVIPSDVTTFSSNVFGSAGSLNYVYIPSAVTLPQGVFNGCEDLTVIFESNSQNCSPVTNIKVNAGKCTPDGWLYELNDNNSYNKEVVNISGYIGVGGEVTVPAQIDGKQVAAVTAYIGIGKVFLEREDITKITFTSSMSVLGNVFDNLINLTEIALADGANEIIFIVRNLSTCTNLTGISLAGGYENYKIKIETRGSTGTVIETQYVDVSNAAEVLAAVKSVNTDQSTMGSCTVYKKA